ncbi:MAG: T9SS type A sorting domain-containing protein [Candidatus Latescibacteria bacterium]|nr:T9SS type A sorting domain-containing protein [Candidatus Latescibacterota bacterium]NIO56818.1 T9SS type A sorting domain-containing protein [Candidatus Latescibacterota bacterium]
MRSRNPLIFIVICLLATGLFLPQLHAQGTYYQGVSDVSLGRFAAWQVVGPGWVTEFFEDDLVKRVLADRICRSHDELNKDWDLYFGATDRADTMLGDIPIFVDSPPVDENIWPEEQNWVYKKFAVLRDGLVGGGSTSVTNYSGRDYTYTISVNSLGPGTRIQTQYDLFYLENTTHGNNSPHGLGYLAYQQNGSSIVKGDFAAPGVVVNVNGSKLDENWVLLFDSQTYGQYAVQIPVLVSFSHRPSKIQCDVDHVRFIFRNKPAGEEMTIFLSLPFGVAAVEPDTAAQWINGLPQDVVDRCRLINRLVNNWPVAVDETFKFEEITPEAPERVFIRNQFTYSYIGDGAIGENWESSGYVSDTPYSLIPPLVALAEDVGLDVTIPSRYMIPQAVDIGFPTKLGPLLMVDLVANVEYELPGAPEHDVHLVGTPDETIWKQRANRMINKSALEADKYRLMAGMLCAFANRGEGASLAMTRDWTREHYLDWMKQTVYDRLFDIEKSRLIQGVPSTICGWYEMDWEGIGPPGEGTWPTFWAYLYNESGRVRVPQDLDGAMGIALEFLYEYALWSGDWGTLNNYWNGSPPFSVGIPDIFYPLELFQDWAYLASSHDIWGGSGAIMDMFNAQLAGYDAYGKIAAALGRDAEARRARYLAAKAQIPFIVRWPSKNYIADYYNTVDEYGLNQVISGFGETEPSGSVFAGYWYGYTDPVFTVDRWADWTLSGERIHLLGYDILRTLVDDQESFKGTLQQFLDLAEQCLNSPGEDKSAGFAEDKLYGFFKWRDELIPPMGKNTLIEWVEKTYTDREGLGGGYPDSAGSIDGAETVYHGYKVSNWYTGWGSWGNPSPKKQATFALMPAMVEACGVPVRVGAWAPAKLVTASYDPDDQKLTATFEQGALAPGSPDPIVRLQVDSQPTSIIVSGGAGTITYDPLWQVVKIPLQGSGPWTVQATILPSSGATWDSVGAEPNLICDPGFEMCGFERPNIEMGWIPYDRVLSETWVHTTVDDAHTGGQCARMTIPNDSSASSLWQYVWVGPGNPVNFDFWYKINSDDIELVYQLKEYPDTIGYYASGGNMLTWGRLTCPPCSTGQWYHFSSSDTLSEDAAIVYVLFYMQKRTFGDYPWREGIDHEIFVDDVVITCPALDTGGGGGKPGDDPVEPGSQVQPLLSRVKTYPNPFNPSTVISFRLGQRKHVDMKIYDIAGRLVRTLINEELAAGPHRITWDGRNDKGARTASGIYFYKLSVAHKVVTGKLALIK